MGWEVASRVGLTMIGRATGKHFLLFTGHERFTGDACEACAIWRSSGGTQISRALAPLSSALRCPLDSAMTRWKSG